MPNYVNNNATFNITELNRSNQLNKYNIIPSIFYYIE